jgi:hypothetical protein
MSFSLESNTMVFTAPLNRSVQTTEMPGARWHAKMSWAAPPNTDGRLIKAFLAQLRGRAGRFYLYDFTHPTPYGSAQGTPQVHGAAQSGNSIVTWGWTPNQAQLLLPGDYLGIGSQLVLVTASASSDGSGGATVTFEPPLRSSPLDNTAITINKPTCTMMLADDTQDAMTYTGPLSVNISIECFEVFV